MSPKKPVKKPSAIRTKREQLTRERKRRPLLRKLLRASQVAGITLAGGLIYLFFSTGYALHSWYSIHGVLINSTGALGLTTREIFISGTDRITTQDVLREIPQSAAIPLKYITPEVMPLYGISIDVLRTKLEQNSWVKQANIRRQPPHTLHIDIAERIPTVVWSDGITRYLADDGGALISEVNDNNEHLLQVEGGVPQRHIPALLAMLGSAPDIMVLVERATWVGNRRWNLYLAGNLTIKLPDEHTIKTWQELVRMHREESLLDRTITTIDLRDPERFYLKLKNNTKINPR